MPVPSWAIFTDPEVARVRLNEMAAAAAGISCEMTIFVLGELDPPIADPEDKGWVKVLASAGTGRILGVTIVRAHASDIIAWNARLGCTLSISKPLPGSKSIPPFPSPA